MSRHKLAENIHNTYIWQRAEYPQLTDNKTSTNKKELMIKTQTSQRKYTKGQEEHVKVLNIFSYQGKANNSHNEIPAQTHQKKLKYWEHKMLMRLGSNWDSLLFLE